MKRILVPTDFSKYSLHAAKLAAAIAKKFDARIFFLHVVSIPINETGIIPGQTQQDVAEGLFILKMVRKNFQKLLSQDFLKDVQVAQAIQFDGVYESVTEQCKKHDIDLIVMGTHGTSGFINEYLIGSNTDKIVRLSEIPVLTVRDEVKDPNFNEVVFASDFEEGVSESFHLIQNFIELFDAKVDLLRVITRDDFYYTEPMLEIMEKFAKEKGLSNYTSHIYTAESVQEGINQFAKRQNADLVATITHGRRGLARLFNGSITSDVMGSSSVPVLSVRSKRR